MLCALPRLVRYDCDRGAQAVVRELGRDGDNTSPGASRRDLAYIEEPSTADRDEDVGSGVFRAGSESDGPLLVGPRGQSAPAATGRSDRRPGGSVLRRENEGGLDLEAGERLREVAGCLILVPGVEDEDLGEGGHRPWCT